MQTLREFAAKSELFQKACELAEVKPTKRQASRWHQRRGKAWAKREEALNPTERRQEQA